MADALTTTSSLTLDQAAYDRVAYWPLRAELYFDAVADVKPTRQSMPGSSVIFYQPTEMTAATGTLNESTDVDAVALADAQVTVTLLEKGNVAKTTAKARGTAYIELDPVVVNLVGYNAGLSVDTIAAAVLAGGTNVRYPGASGGTARNTILPTDVVTAAGVRRAVAELRGANVATFNGSYVGFIHPDASYDFRNATGTLAWTDPHAYSDPTGIWNGDIGTFGGVRFIEASRTPIVADAGSSTTLTDVYQTLIVGKQALAKAWSITDGGGPQPSVFPTPITDNLRRFQGTAWYHLYGIARFREAAIRRLETASTIGTNS